MFYLLLTNALNIVNYLTVLIYSFVSFNVRVNLPNLIITKLSFEFS